MLFRNILQTSSIGIRRCKSFSRALSFSSQKQSSNYSEENSKGDHKMKFILVTGGVISGVGKGVIASSFGTLLNCNGIPVTSLKIDPYINIDAGTFSPYEHGEFASSKFLLTGLKKHLKYFQENAQKKCRQMKILYMSILGYL